MTSAMTPTSYTVNESDSEKGELDSFLERSTTSENVDSDLQMRPRPLLSQRLLTVTPWVLTVFFATLSLVLFDRVRDASAFGSYESGFETDIIPASRIPLEHVRFTRSPHFDAQGQIYLDPVNKSAPWPENMLLFGPPNPEIDANWDRLVGGRYFSVSEEEAKRAWGDKRHEYVDERKGGYTAGLELFHTLHCVNAVRKSFHPEYYPDPWHQAPSHIEHCLDAIRQTIQCYGSTTLIPSKFRAGLHRNYIDSNQMHTCRSFNFLRDFSTSRQQGHENYVERDTSLYDELKHKATIFPKLGNAHEKHEP